MSLLRTRWAAIGAAVAVTLGAGGIGLASATNPSDAVTFVPITPCRLFDTRPDFQVGTRSAPLGPGDIHTVRATGNNGDCTDIPTSATAVSMNMTSTNATAPTFLTVWAAGEMRPDASSMNPVPGAPATPNGVISALNADGQFSVFNLAGSVHVLADINGYYIDHHHDDRYYTKTQVDSAVAVKADAANVYSRAQSDTRFASRIDSVSVGPTDFTYLRTGWSVDVEESVGDARFLAKATTPGVTCASAPLQLPVGRSVTAIQVIYANFNPATPSAEVRIRGTELATGSWILDVITDTTISLPQAGGPTSWGARPATVTGGGPVAAGHAYELELCTASQLDFGGVLISLG
jgi:hypothetical protein